MSNKKQIGIIGATGYTGEELLRCLALHPQAEVAFVTSEKEAGASLASVYPHMPLYKDLQLITAQQAAARAVDLVFLCLPAGESAPLARAFVAKNIKVVDLGADFRFSDPAVYKAWYGMEHPAPDLLDRSVYGLPEWNRDKIRSAAIVGNPGCYPTSVQLAVLPFLKAGLLADAAIIVDSKSGVSGAGKSPTKTTHFVSVNENLSPYKAGRRHRHVGEMETHLQNFSGQKADIIFTPHLTPITRGMLSTIYVQTKTVMDKAQVLQVLKDAYTSEPFVHVLQEDYPSMKMAANSNYCFLGAEAPGGKTIILFSAIDNLGKGASSQAIQNMNIMLGLPEESGLLT
ncbi:MAG TPA: N-acetyl-gamma-glutamyl-phosphate reductase [bacterium]|nr:N-acetyl-gamma-glutamyl-phosphate reductase [bacterium]HPN45718.1 N-acetyl-gamma-glutamyl-phosphate reductase [bacterium]